MKTVQPTGGTLIINPPNPTRPRKLAHDPWYVHAIGDPYWAFAIAASGSYAFYFDTYLLSGERRVYIMDFRPDGSFVPQYYDILYHWKNPDGLSGYAGQVYNYQFRPRTFLSMPHAEFLDWLAAH